MSQGSVYPAVFHFRIIMEAGSAGPEALEVVLRAYRVTSPLAASAASPSSGRYRSCAVSVQVESHEEMVAFDAAVRGVPGVRMLL